MTRFMNGVSALALTTVLLAAPAIAQQAEDTDTGAESNRRLQTVTVTATKRAESAQDIPVTVNAIGEQELEQLGVDVFTDYLTQLPGVTAGGGGPGQSTIYIRGVASTTPNLTTAGVAGLAPNVAFYLDEQPLAQPGRNLDVYAADLERIEVLPGPQGTLFGASSQAGTVRLITNKPVLGEFEGALRLSTSFTEGGEMSNKAEGVVNIPIGDDFALRGVVYSDTQGGYIDNVPGILTAEESARFRLEGTMRDNGVPVSAQRAGFQAGADLSGVDFLEANNSALVEKNFNDTVYNGYRLTGLYEFNPDWQLTVGIAQQKLESDGVFMSDPDLDDWEIQRYSEDKMEDSFTNVSWTLEGQLGALEAVYTGAFTNRDTDQTVDYTDYLFVGQYLPYYICDYNVTYPAGAPMGTCQAPNLFVKSVTDTEVVTQEIRFNTPREYRFRATFGAFYSDLELKERNDFTYPGSVYALDGNGLPGFATNYPLTNGDATPGQVGDETQGYFSDPGPFPAGVIFRNDIRRTDQQVGAFGEATFDIVPDTLAFTLGARWYDVEVDLEGSANGSFYNFYAVEDTDQQVFGTNISALYDGNTPGVPDTAATDGVIFKGTVDWTPTSDLLFYATYSEGFRPGLLNRPGGAAGPAGYTVPYEVDTDEVTNYELGWKTFLADGQLRFNGSAFFVEIEGLQTTIFDPSIVNLFFSDNAANAEVMGVEGDFAYAPDAVEGLTIAGAFSALDTEVTEVLVPTNDVVEGSPLAFAPEFQGNVRVRYEWPLTVAGETYDAHIMPQLVYSSEAYTDIIEINKMELDAWTTLGMSAGVAKDNWSVEVYGQNLTNEAAQYSGTFVYDKSRLTLARPRTFGVRVGVDF